MKLMLVIPNIEGRVGTPPLNIAILSSYINNRSEHEATIADLTFHMDDWKEYLKNRISTEEIDAVGISVLTFDFLQTMEIAGYIKSITDIPVIIGGVHAILKPEEVLERDEVDIVCIGEGEEPLKQILDKNFDCRGIQGVWYKEDGDIVKNQAALLEENLDRLPFPDWSEYELEKYFMVNNSHLTLMSSRGCPYACTYCNNHVLKKKLDGTYVRFRSVDNVIEEVEEVVEKYVPRGLEYIYFIDDIFIMKEEWILEFCEKYIEKGFHKKIRWMANVRANLVTEKIITAMKNAGCYQVGMGIEAADDYIRNSVYKRGMSRRQIDNAIRLIKKSGMLLSLQFIIGAPYESLAMMEESLSMAKEIDADTVMFSILMPLPGTEISEICERENLIEVDKIKNSQTMYSEPMLKSGEATREEINKFYKKARNYQIRKYVTEGFKVRKLMFIWDLLFFFFYQKPKYKLEIQNAFKMTVRKHVLKRMERL